MSPTQHVPSSKQRVPMQLPATHVSPSVQPFPSSQLSPETGVELHVPPGPQVSNVQSLPSLQSIGVPAHVPVRQTSPTVQSLPSLQAPTVNVCTQDPGRAPHPSLLHWLPSLQLTQPPAQHAWPGAQVSVRMQTIPTQVAV